MLEALLSSTYWKFKECIKRRTQKVTSMGLLKAPYLKTKLSVQYSTMRFLKEIFFHPQATHYANYLQEF